jgi:hypothetical protein
MCVGSKADEFLSSFMKNWEFCSVDARGMSRGLVTEWNEKFDTISTNVMPSRIQL